jgi:hypothetical protein
MRLIRVVILWVVGAGLLGPAPSVEVWEVVNGYATVWNQWVTSRNVRAERGLSSANALDVKEFQQWQSVKDNWRRVQNVVDEEYRGVYRR